MKLRTFQLFVAIILFSLSSTYAQLDLKRIAKDAERSVNRRVERTIDRGVDDALDGAEDEVRGKNRKKRKNDQDRNDDSGSVTVIKEVIPFNFSGNLTVSIDGTGSIEDNLIKVVANNYEFAVRPMLIKKPNNLMIYDKQNESITKVNTELYEDKALREYLQYEAHNPKSSKTELERTTEIKEINSYIARKYIVEGDDYEGEVWLSAEVDLDYDLFSAMMEYQSLDLGTMYGFPLEMHISYKNGDTLDMMVKSVEDGNPDKALLDVSSYDLIDMTDLKSGN